MEPSISSSLISTPDQPRALMPTHGTRPASDLPVELILMVVSYLRSSCQSTNPIVRRGRVAALKTASLLSRRWVAPARRYLFRCLIVGFEDASFSLARVMFVSSRPDLRCQVHHIHIRESTQAHSWLAEPLQTWLCVAFPMLNSVSADQSQAVQTLFRAPIGLLAGKNVEYVDLKSHSIRDLSLDHYAVAWPVPTTRLATLQLNLRSAPAAQAKIMRDLAGSETVTTLKSLLLAVENQGVREYLQPLLSPFQSLQTFTLKVRSSGTLWWGDRELPLSSLVNLTRLNLDMWHHPVPIGSCRALLKNAHEAPKLTELRLTITTHKTFALSKKHWKEFKPFPNQEIEEPIISPELIDRLKSLRITFRGVSKIHDWAKFKALFGSASRLIKTPSKMVIEGEPELELWRLFEDHGL